MPPDPASASSPGSAPPAALAAPVVTSASAGAPPASGDRAVGAGRGLLYITAAKIWFMVGAAAINFLLPRLLRSKDVYGDYSLVVSIVSTLNNVMVTATIQAVSKFSSAGPSHVEGAKRAALRLQLVAGTAIALAFFVAAPAIAAAERDASLVPGLRLSTGIVLAYAFYAVFVGAANGAREFHKQAALDATFTALRALLVCGAAVLFTSVLAAVGGFVLAAAAILLVSIALVGLGRVEVRTAPSAMARFMAPVALYLLILNLLMFVDGWVLKRLVAGAAEAAGLALPAKVASASVGVYAAAQNVARIPYQAILSVTFVVFPLVSQSTFAADAARTRGYVVKSIRLSLLVVTAMAAAVAARPEALLDFLPAEYGAAAPALSVLAFAYVAFSLLSIAGTIINGAGRTMPTMVIAAVTLGLDVLLVAAGVSYALASGGTRDPLLWAAAGTTAAMTVGLGLALIYLQRAFGASLGLLTLGRAAAAAAVAIAVGRLVLPLHGRVGALVSATAAGAAYLAVLFLTREVTVAELRALGGRRAR